MLPLGTARYLFGLFAVLCLAATGRAAPPAAPPPPKEYAVQIRYRIDALGTDRLTQYFDMLRFFQSLGFVLDPNFEENPRDPEQTRLVGTIPSATARRLLEEPHVRSLLLMPAGFKVPAEGVSLVKVYLTLASGLPLLQQQLLADQSRGKLRQLGFREGIGYDDRGHTRLVGLVPAGNLETLLKDLRGQLSGWLAPVTPVAELPVPLRDISPIWVTEVVPEPDGMPPPRGWGEMPEPVQVNDPAVKIGPHLRALMGGEKQTPVRMEVLLTVAPSEVEQDWRRALRQAAPDLVLEGRLGTVVTGVAPPRAAARLAELPFVTAVRLPRPALPALATAPATNPDLRAMFQASGLSSLFARGYRGRGVRIAIVDGDFRGYDRLKGKDLPANLHYVDLTAERNPSLLPDPFPGDSTVLGPGTQAALAALRAAPEADLTLIRIDPAAPHQLAAVVRLVNGERYYSDSVYQRNQELETAATDLRTRNADLLRLRQEAVNITISPEDRLNEPKDTPRRREMEEALHRREQYFKMQADYDRALKNLHDRRSRYSALLEAERNLRTVRVVSSALIWNAGYPVGGPGLTRFLEETPLRRALWFQAAGNTRGQAWTGLLQDADGNRVMEFAPPKSPQGTRPGPDDWWRTELNFLSWQPHGKERTLELPAKGRFRLSVQWQEAHDPRFFPGGEAAYLRPLAELRLVVLRQRDPSGTRVAADEFDLVARSTGLPQRLNSDPASATYEQDVEFVVETPGRYALRLEGVKAPGNQPLEVPAVPAMQQAWDLWPRIFVETLDESSRLAGRALWGDYATDRGTLGTPADARVLITVGAANLSGQPLPVSTAGPPYLRDLLRKPNILAPDGVLSGGGAIIYGTGTATPFAAGAAATALSAGTPPTTWLRMLSTQACRGLARLGG
jgi:hypothetical protein